MSDKTDVACVACDHTTHTRVTEARPGKTMVRCDHCGLIFVIPQWTDSVAVDVFAHWDGWPEGISGENTEKRRDSMRFVAQQINNQIPTGGRLLDVGCAAGDFFEVIQTESVHAQQRPIWQFSGVEPDPKWQDFTYQNAQVVASSLRECNFPDAIFDVVTILDALYYVPEPDRELAEMARILKPGGLFVFDIPGQFYLKLRGVLGGLLALERTRTFAAYPFYFSDTALNIMLQRAGLHVVKLSADQGVVQPKPLIRFSMSAYMGLAKSITKLSNRWLPICPKLIYFTRRIEM